MAKNLHNNRAKKVKNDEFYTFFEDIEKELKSYDKKQFNNKIVYCCCDSSESNFVKYFINNFEEFGLKKLFFSCIQDNSIYEYDYMSKSIVKYKSGVDTSFYSIDISDMIDYCDIIATNPPFSKFRDFFDKIKHKNYLIVSSFNSITYSTVFKEILKNNCRVGINRIYWFFDKNNDYRDVAATWFTNLLFKNKDKKEVKLSKLYNDNVYYNYDNYPNNIIEVSKIVDIPIDYTGIMGVPVTFLLKRYNFDFKIIGSTECRLLQSESKFGKTASINGKQVYKRLFITKCEKGNK